MTCKNKTAKVMVNNKVVRFRAHGVVHGGVFRQSFHCSFIPVAPFLWISPSAHRLLKVRVGEAHVEIFHPQSHIRHRKTELTIPPYVQYNTLPADGLRYSSFHSYIYNLRKETHAPAAIHSRLVNFKCRRSFMSVQWTSPLNMNLSIFFHS